MQKLTIKQLKNAYCDAIGLAFDEFMEIREIAEEDLLKILTRTDLEKICKYAILKNKLAGVGEVFVKTPLPKTITPILEESQMKGREILSARLIDCLTAGDLVGGRIMIEVESLLDYNEDYLSKIVDFCATTESPVLIRMGQTLEEVGKVVNKFGMSPAEVLEQYGFLDRECYVYGMNFIDKDDQKLLKKYCPTIILSPRDDAEEGRGAINLYNLIFHALKFVFSSGKCYNVNMFLEGKLAMQNTANLMYEGGLVDADEVLNALESDQGRLEIEYDKDCPRRTILDKTVEIQEDEKLKTTLSTLREEIKGIANKIKEKI